MDMKQLRRVKPLGFATTESDILLVLDPFILEPYMRPGAMDQLWTAILETLALNEVEVPIGDQGQVAVVVVVPQRAVLVKQELGVDAGLVLDGNIPRDAR